MDKKLKRVPMNDGTYTYLFNLLRRYRYENIGGSGFSIMSGCEDGASPDYDASRPRVSMFTAILEQIVRIGLITFALGAVFDMIYAMNHTYYDHYGLAIEALPNKLIGALAKGYLHQFPFVMLLMVILMTGLLNLRGHHFKESAKKVDLTIFKYLALYGFLLFIGHKWLIFSFDAGYLGNSVYRRQENNVMFVTMLAIFFVAAFFSKFNLEKRHVFITVAGMSGYLAVYRFSDYVWDGTEWLFVYLLKLSSF